MQSLDAIYSGELGRLYPKMPVRDKSGVFELRAIKTLKNMDFYIVLTIVETF